MSRSIRGDEPNAPLPSARLDRARRFNQLMPID